jgi:hypothetical protein
MEVFVHEYEIRILRADRGIGTVFRFAQLDDRAAPREAEKLAKWSPFEIWRGVMDCIYATAPPRTTGQNSRTLGRPQFYLAGIGFLQAALLDRKPHRFHGRARVLTGTKPAGLDQ